MGEEDIRITMDLLQQIKPHQVYAAGDLADPHGTHKVCLDIVFESLRRLKKAGETGYRTAGYGCTKVPGRSGILLI